MIPTPPGWTRRHDGDRVVLEAPRGTSGVIGYRERVRPLLPIRALIDERLAKHPEFALVEERLEPVVTAEGEYAMLATLRGTADGAPVQHDLGFLLAEDFYALTSGVVQDPAQFAAFTDTVRDLLRRDAHRLGVRRRFFLHDTPLGWARTPRGLVADWRPPPPAADLAVLTIWPATPRWPSEDAVAVADALLEEDRAAGLVVEHRAGPDPLSSVHGLAGACWEVVGTIGGRRLYQDLVVFEDARYLYPLRLAHLDPERRAADRAVLLAVARSAQPIPEPAHPSSVGTTSFAHWAS